MTDQEREKFDEMITDFCATMQIRLQGTTFWWTTLNKYSLKEVFEALKDSAGDSTKLEFIRPTPAEIARRIDNKKNNRYFKQPETDIRYFPPQNFFDNIKKQLEDSSIDEIGNDTYMKSKQYLTGKQE